MLLRKIEEKLKPFLTIPFFIRFGFWIAYRCLFVSNMITSTGRIFIDWCAFDMTVGFSAPQLNSFDCWLYRPGRWNTLTGLCQVSMVCSRITLQNDIKMDAARTSHLNAELRTWLCLLRNANYDHYHVITRVLHCYALSATNKTKTIPW